MIIIIITAQIREKIYDSFISHGIFPEEQKGCCKRTRGTEVLLYIDQQVLNESKNLAMAWIDHKKAYDMGLPKLDTTLSQNIQKYPTKLYSLSKGPCQPGEWNWQQEEKALQRWRSNKLYSREMHYHHYYLC